MSARYGHLRTDDLHDELRSLAQKRSQQHQIEAGKLSPKTSSNDAAQPFKPLTANGLRRLRLGKTDGALGAIRTPDPQIRRTTPANDNDA
jgi:hypothetical protein